MPQSSFFEPVIRSCGSYAGPTAAAGSIPVVVLPCAAGLKHHDLNTALLD